jgi:hypothetical protein
MESTRHLTEAGMHVELVAYGRRDGRWEAHVASWHCLSPSPNAAELMAHPTDLTSSWSAALWPSVNGPTSARALDALEAELRETLADTRTRYLGLYERRGN